MVKYVPLTLALVFFLTGCKDKLSDCIDDFTITGKGRISITIEQHQYCVNYAKDKSS